ncbi:MAG TPA: hypothetical protein ENN87_04385 [Phycisphaerales bacterium]|nr:hypothetical protein [Phycisphaerales bacterium]
MLFVFLLAACNSSEAAPGPGASTGNAGDVADDSTEDTDDSSESTALLEETAFDPHWGMMGVFTDAASCTTCHRANETAGVMTYDGTDVSPGAGWENSMMALAFADPYFQAAVAEETAQFPHLAGFIEDTCLTCHAPMGRTHAQQTGEDLDADGYYRFETALGHMHAREGVSCTACHQIQDDGSLGEPLSFSGNYRILSQAEWTDMGLDRPEIYGPYEAPAANAMSQATQYDPVHGPHMKDSGQCATCHTLFTPTLDLAGVPTGKAFPEQTPYQEWENSVYAPGRAKQASCQDCHMPAPAGYGTQIAVKQDGSPNANWPTRSPFHTHGFVGGNTHTLEVLLAFRSLLGIEGNTSVEGLEAQIEATRAQLENRSAEIAIETVTENAGQLEIPVRVTNKTGHKLPTSYPSRRAWIHLQVTDANGATVFESGRADERGRISTDARALQHACVAGDKVAGFDYSTCYEPHRDVITHPDQVAIYESVLGDVEGEITYVLLHASEYLKDNRLPPEGFARSAVPGTNEGLPADHASAIIGVPDSDTDFNAETAGGGSGQDVVHYRVDTGAFTAPFTIEAALRYQSVRPGFVAGLHHDEEPRVARYKQMVDLIPPTVETLASDDTLLVAN